MFDLHLDIYEGILECDLLICTWLAFKDHAALSGLQVARYFF